MSSINIAHTSFCALRAFKTYAFTYAGKPFICAGMSTLGELLKQLREERNMRQVDLASAVGQNQSTIHSLESGRIKSLKQWERYADAFDIDRDKFREMLTGVIVSEPSPQPKPSRNITAHPAPPMSDRDVPVYGRAQGGADGVFLFNGEVIGWEIRPPQLAGVKEAYATYVDGESMYPRYKPGETVWLNPHKPAARGDDVVVQMRPADEHAPPYGFIKEYVRRTPTKLVVCQHNPASEIEFDLTDVVSIHPIVFAQRG